MHGCSLGMCSTAILALFDGNIGFIRRQYWLYSTAKLLNISTGFGVWGRGHIILIAQVIEFDDFENPPIEKIRRRFEI